MPEWRYSLPNGETHVQDELVFRQDPLFTGMTVQDSYLQPLRTVTVTFAGTPSYETMFRLGWRQAEEGPQGSLPPIPNLNGDVFPPIGMSGMSWVVNPPSLAGVLPFQVFDSVLPFLNPPPPNRNLGAFLEGVRSIFDKGEVILPGARNRFEHMLVDGELNPNVRALRGSFPGIIQTNPQDWARHQLPLEDQLEWQQQWERQWTQEIHGHLEAERVRLPPVEEIPLGPSGPAGLEELVGQIPIRTELTVLPADEPRRPLGFAMRERMGVAVMNPRGLMRSGLSSEPEVQAPPVEEVPTMPTGRSRFDRFD